MNIEWLNYFVMLAETKNYKLASEKIGIATPTLSKAISELENHFKTKLVLRTNRFLGLTDAGDLLFAQSKILLNSLSILENMMEQLKSGEPDGEIVIVGDEISQAFLLPKLISKLLTKYPKIQPKLITCNPLEIEKYIQEGKANLAILLNTPTISGLNYIRCGELNYLIAGIPQPLKEWDKLSYIGLTGKAKKLLNHSNDWPEKDFKREITAETDSVFSMLSLSETGIGAIYAPEIFVREKIEIGTLSVVSTPPFKSISPVYLIWPKDSYLSLTFGEILNTLQNSLRSFLISAVKN
jgi:DNA-binding transcriptional LysR family regulator